VLDSDDQVLALRTSLTIAANWPRWNFTGEIMDSRAARNDEGSFVNATIVNTLEPLQLAAERRWDELAKGGNATARFGRTTADLASRRLLARNGFRNTPNSFVGLDFNWRSATGHTRRVLSLQPMFALPRQRSDLLDNEAELDNRSENTRLTGLLYAQAPGEGGDQLEFYWLGLEAEEILDRRRLQTLGVWISRDAATARWHYEAELALQSSSRLWSSSSARRSSSSPSTANGASSARKSWRA
jgi:hypothetical protein